MAGISRAITLLLLLKKEEEMMFWDKDDCNTLRVARGPRCCRDESFDFLATVDLGETATTWAISFFLSFLFETDEGFPMAGAAALRAKEVVPPL
jgi:hypothetical protein